MGDRKSGRVTSGVWERKREVLSFSLPDPARIFIRTFNDRIETARKWRALSSLVWHNICNTILPGMSIEYTIETDGGQSFRTQGQSFSRLSHQCYLNQLITVLPVKQSTIKEKFIKWAKQTKPQTGWTKQIKLFSPIDQLDARRTVTMEAGVTLPYKKPAVGNLTVAMSTSPSCGNVLKHDWLMKWNPIESCQKKSKLAFAE